MKYLSTPSRIEAAVDLLRRCNLHTKVEELGADALATMINTSLQAVLEPTAFMSSEGITGQTDRPRKRRAESSRGTFCRLDRNPPYTISLPSESRNSSRTQVSSNIVGQPTDTAVTGELTSFELQEVGQDLAVSPTNMPAASVHDPSIGFGSWDDALWLEMPPSLFLAPSSLGL